MRQKWCAKGPLVRRREVPRWLKQSDLWLTNNNDMRGMPESFVPAAAFLRQRLGCNVNFEWRSWNGELFNVRAPEVFPLSETMRYKLRNALKRLDSKGVHILKSNLHRSFPRRDNVPPRSVKMWVIRELESKVKQQERNCHGQKE